MSDGGPERAFLGVEVWKSSHRWRVGRSAVRSIAWLDGSRRIRVSLSNPRTFGGISPSLPAHGKISKVKNRRIEIDCCGQANDPAVRCGAIGGADELPAMIIGIMYD